MHNTIKFQELKNLLSHLLWGQKYALHSASVALSKAQLLGVPKEQAIEAVLEMSEFLHENPYFVYECWVAVSQQLSHPDENQLVLVEAYAIETTAD